MNAKPKIARHFAIGDVQGCLDPLKRLLDKIQYEPKADQLWFAGDLVNRGPQSLETLRFIKSLPNIVCVLGNHDLALLAVAVEATELRPEDSFAEILHAQDRVELLEWLRNFGFLHHSPELGYTLVHAGIHPSWQLEQAKSYAQEIEEHLKGPNYKEYLKYIFGPKPDIWEPNLTGWDRSRLITNIFTRMRFCLPNGQLDFKATGTLKQHPELIPWYQFAKRPTQNERILFGHWSALRGITNNPNAIALDTGCVWGQCLTAFHLETQTRSSIDCEKA